MTHGQIDEAASAALLAAVADPVRWAVLRQLATAGACVCDLRGPVPVAANLMSYHLKVLREAGLVVGTKCGRRINYRLADDALQRLHEAIPAGPVGVDGRSCGASAAYRHVDAGRGDGLAGVRQDANAARMSRT